MAETIEVMDDPSPPTPLLAWLRPLTTRIINPITRRFTGRLPGFGTVVHVGRRSSRVYRAPVNVFRHGDAWVIALTYGSDVQWVRNVLAAGGCEVETRGRTIALTAPRVVHDPSASMIPRPVRTFLRLMHVTEFLLLDPRQDPGPIPT